MNGEISKFAMDVSILSLLWESEWYSWCMFHFIRSSWKNFGPQNSESSGLSPLRTRWLMHIQSGVSCFLQMYTLACSVTYRDRNVRSDGRRWSDHCFFFAFLGFLLFLARSAQPSLLVTQVWRWSSMFPWAVAESVWFQKSEDVITQWE